MDHKKEGVGRLVKLERGKIFGNGTKFTELRNNDSIVPSNESLGTFRVKQVVSDTEAIVFESNSDIDFKDDKYIVYPHLDQSKVYEEVANMIVNDEALAIFPEGGSHDRTQMLPLKPGACIFVWEAKKKLFKDVPIIPIGLTYFGAHKFRTRVIVKVGKPIHYEFDQSRINEPEYKREKIGSMLKTLEEGMNKVLVNAPSYREKKLIY